MSASSSTSCGASSTVEWKCKWSPWDYDFPKLAGKEYDGLFISNGPGDPAMVESTVKHIATALYEARTPIFGICLGHQLLARAAGAQTTKMKFGNRGHNIPCTSLLSGKCYITSQKPRFRGRFEHATV